MLPPLPLSTLPPPSAQSNAPRVDARSGHKVRPPIESNAQCARRAPTASAPSVTSRQSAGILPLRARRERLNGRPTARLGGKLGVGMRPMKAAAAIRVIQNAGRLPNAHGVPVHTGDPWLIGIHALGRPEVVTVSARSRNARHRSIPRSHPYPISHRQASGPGYRKTFLGRSSVRA